MGLWLALGLMTLIALALVVAPLLRRARATATRRDYDLRVYRAQLAELAREQERGLLGEREAAAARLEVERRMLAADAADRARGQNGALRGRPWPIALALLLALPALAGGLYWRIGSPGEPAAPFAERAEERAQMAAAERSRQAALPAVETMIARLEQRLEATPDDLDAWRRLGNAYALIDRFGEAAHAYREAIRRNDEVADLHAALGEVLVFAEGGVIGPEAGAAFKRALELDPADVRARFYSGYALLQGGEQQRALDAWAALIGDAPADAPWLPDLRERAAAVAKGLGQDPDQVLPAPRPVTAAEPARDPTELRQAAAGLEAQLAANPKDYQGWIRLAQTWVQLGEPARAQEALTRGSEAYRGAPFVQQQLQTAAAGLGLELGDGPTRRGPTAEQMQAAQDLPAEDREDMIRGMVQGLAARLEQQPDDLEGWRMLARSWDVLGEPAKSADAYGQVARRAPDDVAAQVDYAEALLTLEPAHAPPSPQLIAQLRRVLALDADNPEALFHLGRAAAAQDDASGAAQHWRRLLAQLPPNSPERAAVERLLQELETKG